ncbi:ABC transporter permease subunit [Streptomyces sp. NPDC050264]|uniref:ABC transporter permease subunit n=1 Tax=Streptomyces sp. NPDC050264 TaxID=3155038 RepID=UPI003414F7DB
MTATTTVTTDVSGGDRPAREPRARFRDLVAAEWIKHRSLRSTWIAYGAAALAVIGFNAGTAYDTYSHWTLQVSKDRAAFVGDGMALQHAFTSNAALLMALALGAIGALVILGEYSTGTNRTTFAAVPARRSVIAAKAVVVTVVTTVFGAVVAGVSFALTQAILDRRDAGVSIGDPGAFRIVLASALLAPVCALAGFALGAVVRHTASTMITSVVVILVLPLFLTDGRHWSAVAGHTLPYRAWLRLVDVNYSPIAFSWSTGGAWTVYTVWAGVACAIAVTSVHRRDQ